jgi:hypothetical protein
MVLVQALIAALTRSAGKLLNTAFSWATVLLFGRVSESRQIYVSVIAFGSVIWLLALVGVAFPVLGTFLLSFVPLPQWVDKTWVRLAMLAAVVVLPALVGVLSILMLEKNRRPRGASATTTAILKGYPYTVGLAMTLTMMIVFAPIIKVRTLSRRWTSEHVPVVVKPPDYAHVVDAIQRALAEGGIRTDRGKASWMLRGPTKILTLFARGAISDLVSDQMVLLFSATVEVVLHPSDLIINGRAGIAARARAIVAARLVFTPAYLTWDKEANEIEDRLRAVWNARRTRPMHTLDEEVRAVEADLHRIELPYEEWDVLFREVLLLERELNRMRHFRATALEVEVSAAESPEQRVVETVLTRALDMAASIVVALVASLVARATQPR